MQTAVKYNLLRHVEQSLKRAHTHSHASRRCAHPPPSPTPHPPPASFINRSFAHATPGGARVWKAAATSDQGTPWAARAKQRTRPGGRTVVVEETPPRGGYAGASPGRRGRTDDISGPPHTPAAMTRRIISVLGDTGTPRPMVRVGLGGRGPGGGGGGGLEYARRAFFVLVSIVLWPSFFVSLGGWLDGRCWWWRLSWGCW